jgi:hypothetical protein
MCHPIHPLHQPNMQPLLNLTPPNILFFFFLLLIPLVEVYGERDGDLIKIGVSLGLSLPKNIVFIWCPIYD